MQKVIHRGFICILIFVAIMMYLAYRSPQNVIFNPEDQVQICDLIPLTETHPEKDLTTYTFDVSGRIDACDSLFVQSKHTEVCIYADSELLYSLKRGQMPWMNTTGTVYDIVYLPSSVNMIDVTVRNLYPEVANNFALFSVGNGSEIFRTLAKTSFVPTIISITEVFIGALLLVIWFFFRKKGQNQFALFYLALFSAAIGLWSLSGGVYFVLILYNQAAASTGAFVSLMFLIVPFVQFTKYYFGYSRRFADLLSLSACIMTIVLVSLHLAGVAGLKQTVTVTHIHIALAALFYLYGFIRYTISGKPSHRKLINLLATVILLGSAVIDFSMYFSGSIQTNFSGRFGFIIYFFILGAETINDMIAKLHESRKSAIYKELAYKDNLTGLFNRNAYMEWEQSLVSPDGISIVNLDLNDLKLCNDRLGHASGDKYITDSARMISEIFKPYGKCYRIGGDEFAVVVEPTYTLEQIRDLLDELDKKQESYNKASDKIQMQLAYGYAKFDPQTDASIEAVGIRADTRMYEHKKKLKGNYSGQVEALAAETVRT